MSAVRRESMSSAVRHSTCARAANCVAGAVADSRCRSTTSSATPDARPWLKTLKTWRRGERARRVNGGQVRGLRTLKCTTRSLKVVRCERASPAASFALLSCCTLFFSQVHNSAS
eukprot:6200707-Pleurochrysis_carterae.AAC.11